MNKSISSTTLNWCQIDALNDIGKVRSQNEDSYLLQPWSDRSAVLAVVADGIGGSRSGQIASKIAVDTFAELLEHPLPSDMGKQYDLLLDQCYQADERIREKAYQSFKTLGMGTTIIAAIITPNHCVYVYAGDSRLYHFRQGKINYQTSDHTLVQTLVEIGRIKPEDIRTHPMRSVLNSCLGGKNAEGNFSVDPKWKEGNNPPAIELEAHDLLLLCSDGLTNLVSNQEIETIIQDNDNNPTSFNQKLVKQALNNGGDDNITVLSVFLCRTASDSILGGGAPIFRNQKN